MKWVVLSLIVGWTCRTNEVKGQHPADNYTVVPLCSLSLNRTATKLTSTQLGTVSPAVKGYQWNTSDNETRAWRPQGVAGVNMGCKQFSVVSWYGRYINNPSPCDGDNLDYRNRGSRLSFVDITDMDSIRYRHVLLVDETYTTFYDMHAGGLTIVNDTLYAPDSRGATDAMYAFDLTTIKEVPVADRGSYHNYAYILQKIPTPTDSLPIQPSFVTYDWDEQQLLVGSFKNCGSPFCTSNADNRALWYSPGNADRNSYFYDGFFGRMQGMAARDDLNQSTKKALWVSRSYGYSNNSQLYALNLEMGTNTQQGQSVVIGNNYAEFTFPPGLEDLYLEPGGDTLWTCTEFSPEHPICVATTANQRYVFAIPTANILPPGACLTDVNYLQNDFVEDTVCTLDTLMYQAATEYVAYSSFDPALENWIEVNAVADSLAGRDRSIFMWVKQSATVSGSSQMLFAINSATGGNVSLMQIGTNEKLGIYDGSSSHYGTTTITDGNWHQVGVTYEASTGLTTVYVDGVSEVSFTDSQPATTTDLFSLGQEFDSGLSMGNFFEGEMTEVSIWNTLLTPTDIALLMARAIDQNHPARANLVAYYPMNKRCGEDLTRVEDVSGNGLDGHAFGEIGANGIAVQSVSTLAVIPGFNAAAYFDKTWSQNGMAFSSADSASISTDSSANYSLELTRGPFHIFDDWRITQTLIPTLFSPTLCEQESIVVNGTTYNAQNPTGRERFTQIGPNGCDSLVEVSINIQTVNVGTALAGNTLTADEANATAYQWLDCANGFSPLPGATQQSYSATISGDFAVAVTLNNCTDTSGCTTVIGVMREESLNHTLARVYPNPTEEVVNIEWKGAKEKPTLLLRNFTGQVINQWEGNLNEDQHFDLSAFPAGIYVLEIQTTTHYQVAKILKQ